MKRKAPDFRLDLAILPMRANDYNRAHWAVRAKKLEEWCQFICVSLRPEELRWLREHPAKRRVVITFFHSKPYDTDNLYACAKQSVDAMKDTKNGLGIIVDDSPAWLELEVRQEIVKHRHLQLTRIEIWREP